MRAIAEKLGRSPSTVSRELRRNRDPGSGQYRPFTAHKLAAQRRARPRAGKIARDEVLRQFVQERLAKRWSPEQVSQALRREFPATRARHVVHETIYQAVYRPELGGLSRELPARVLRTRRRRRRPHRRPGERRPNGITAMTMIDQRPAEAAGRSELRALGGRPDYRGVQPVGDRHAGGPGVAVHDLAAPARPAHRRGGP